MNERFREDGGRSSRQRDAIVRIFLAADTHLTVDELYDRVHRSDPGVGYTTVWRTLKALEAKGLAIPHRFGATMTRYEPKESRGHHDHLICTSCGRVEEFLDTRIEAAQDRIARAHGFTITHHTLELYGTCRTCTRHARK